MSTAEVLLLAGAVVALAWLAVRTAVTSAVQRAVEREFRQWEVRFSKLHERRVEVMEGVMDRLVAIRWALLSATGILQPGDDRYGVKHLEEAAEAGNEARRYFMARSYYLPTGPACRIKELLAELQETWANLYTGAEGLIQQGRSPGGPEQELMATGRAALRNKVPALIAQVEEEFRQVLGVKSNSAGEADR